MLLYFVFSVLFSTDVKNVNVYYIGAFIGNIVKHNCDVIFNHHMYLSSMYVAIIYFVTYIMRVSMLSHDKFVNCYWLISL